MGNGFLKFEKLPEDPARVSFVGNGPVKVGTGRRDWGRGLGRRQGGSLVPGRRLPVSACTQQPQPIIAASCRAPGLSRLPLPGRSATWQAWKLARLAALTTASRLTYGRTEQYHHGKNMEGPASLRKPRHAVHVRPEGTDCLLPGILRGGGKQKTVGVEYTSTLPFILTAAVQRDGRGRSLGRPCTLARLLGNSTTARGGHRMWIERAYPPSVSCNGPSLRKAGKSIQDPSVARTACTGSARSRGCCS